MEDKSIALAKSTEISGSFRDRVGHFLSISYKTKNKQKKKVKKASWVSSDTAALKKTTAFCK